MKRILAVLLILMLPATSLAGAKTKSYKQSGISMEPTIESGTLCRFEIGAEIERNDIVCFEDPKGTPSIKRAVAVPGDTVYCLNSVTHVVNSDTGEDTALDEYLSTYFPDGSSDDYEACVLGEDEYFLVGDNVANSHDSRDWKDSDPEGDIGPVSGDRIIGKYIGTEASGGLLNGLGGLFSGN